LFGSKNISIRPEFQKDEAGRISKTVLGKARDSKIKSPPYSTDLSPSSTLKGEDLKTQRTSKQI
jgi:hypothetical protein